MSNLGDDAELNLDQYDEVVWMLDHVDGDPNDPSIPPLTSIDLSDAVNTLSEGQPDGLGIGGIPGVPIYPYVGDFKQPGVKK